jgi:hypothetical protein
MDIFDMRGVEDASRPRGRLRQMLCLFLTMQLLTTSSRVHSEPSPCDEASCVDVLYSTRITANRLSLTTGLVPYSIVARDCDRTFLLGSPWRPEKAIRELIVPRANYGEARDVQEVAASGGMVAAEFARRDRVCAWALKVVLILVLVSQALSTPK